MYNTISSNNGNPSNTSLPTLNTLNISSITTYSANSGGNITDEGGSLVTQKGVCWSSNSDSPTLLNSHTVDGNGSGVFTSQITGLSSNTSYYIRAYATNSFGISYGNTLQFSTNAGNSIPTIETSPIVNVGTTSANSGGNVLNDGGLSVSTKGSVGLSPNPTNTNVNYMTIDGTGLGSFSSTLTNLNHSTTYYVRAYAAIV